MKVSYPLSLKVSIWLLLNLLLLSVVGFGFFVFQGGLGWNALVAGPSGERAQATANVIAGEISAAGRDQRPAVLARFGTAYGAEIRLLRMDEPDSAVLAALPEEVRSRIDWRQFRFGGGGPGGPGRGRAGTGRKEGGRRSGSRDGPAPPGRDPGDLQRREPPDPGRPSGGFEPGRDRWRFVIRAGSPASYWLGFRVPGVPSGRIRFPIPSLLLVRLDSLWSVMSFLNLQPWLLAGTAVLALSILFWLPLVHGITRALSRLTSATEKIADGRFDTRVSEVRHDELGKLGASVNRMAARLDTHMTGQKRFLGDVAHELCSPLARLQLATGILGERAPPEMRETVADVRDEVQQMSALVNELLAFTKAGWQRPEPVLADVSVGGIVREVLAREAPSGRVVVDVAEELRVQAVPEILSRAVANLTRNALRYGGAAGPVRVSATCAGPRTLVVVEDEGPGVPEGALDRLGEPFFRPEEARTRELGGVGLGLSIVRSGINACGGEVRFTNRSPKGFRAELNLATSTRPPDARASDQKASSPCSEDGDSAPRNAP